jgi:hypothetical protein
MDTGLTFEPRPESDAETEMVAWLADVQAFLRSMPSLTERKRLYQCQ